MFAAFQRSIIFVIAEASGPRAEGCPRHDIFKCVTTIEVVRNQAECILLRVPKESRLSEDLGPT